MSRVLWACAGGKQRITLNSADRIYAELRDLSFAAVGPQLRQRAMAIQSDYKTSKVTQTAADDGASGPLMLEWSSNSPHERSPADRTAEVQVRNVCMQNGAEICT